MKTGCLAKMCPKAEGGEEMVDDVSTFPSQHRKAPFPCISPPFSLMPAAPIAVLLLSNRTERLRFHSRSHRRAEPPRQPARGTGNEVCAGRCMPAANRLVKLLLQLPLPPGALGQPGAAHQAEKLNKQTNKTKRGGCFVFFVSLCFLVVFILLFWGFFVGFLFFLLGADLRTPAASLPRRARG